MKGKKFYDAESRGLYHKFKFLRQELIQYSNKLMFGHFHLVQVFAAKWD